MNITSFPFKALCKMARRNNGIVQVLFTREKMYANESEQEDHILLNLHMDVMQFQEGQHYWIDVKPAFPY